MTFDHKIRIATLMAGLLFLGACGGGGSGASNNNTGGIPPGPEIEPTAINLSSDPGDYIGGGRDYSYSQADSIITLTVAGAYLSIQIQGDELWTGDFLLPDSLTQLEVGTYSNLTRYPFHDASVGGLSWSGEGRGCNTLTGSITIENVTYDGDALTSIDLQFEQYCEGGTFALRGDIHWHVDDATAPPGPAAVPAGLWAPAAGVTPATGNYVYLESQAGDYIGQGATYLYTLATAQISFNVADAHLSISITGNEFWYGDFEGINTSGRIEAGYYGDLKRYPFHNPVKGGLSWSGEGRGCNTLTGWFVVDRVTYDGATLTAIDLRFEQHCEGGGPALNGEIRWDINDDTGAPGPSEPPAGLWQPPVGVLPPTANYVYLESEPGDWVGAGATYLYTPFDSQISTESTEAFLGIRVDGDERWFGRFQGMASLSRLQVGYYGDLQRYLFHNPAVGGLEWSGEGRGCGTLTGWFFIDSVTYDGDTLTAVELRFEQHCEGAGPALYGAIRWDASDDSVAPGPTEPPAGLWEPPVGAVPATGSYAYLQSEPGDPVGQGLSYLYTQANSLMTGITQGAHFTLGIRGEEDWSGDFQAMNSLTLLEAGYYGEVMQFPAENPTRGGLNWSGEGRACFDLTGWFVIDSVTYEGTTLTAIELRFEQQCGDGGPALYGALRWDANDPTQPPGPAEPPAGLWAPPVGAVPESGNYVYLDSDPGDWVGAGATYLYTGSTAVLSLGQAPGRVAVTVNGDEGWRGDFQAMYTLDRLEAGYYGDLQRYPFHNPASGGMSWTGEGRGCNTLTGWFVVDSVTYDGETLIAIDLRFEQRCEGGDPALRGAIHWETGDTTEPPGPEQPPPAGLWEPPVGSVPATGDYVYLESEVGDFVGQGATYLYTAADSQFTASSSDAFFNIRVDSSETWSGRFQGMNSISRLEVGYYGDLQRYPIHNPAKGGLSWGGQGRGCNTLTGWFVVDSVTYDGATLNAIELRFEQHCEGGDPALNGSLRWTAQ